MNNRLIQAARDVQGLFSLSNGEYDAGRVGAALFTASGNIYTGISMDLACGIGFCAEHAAAAEMLKAHETEVRAMVAVGFDGTIWPPCGRCRELIYQLDPKNAETQVILAPDRAVPLSDLLPEYWNTGNKNTPET